MFRTLVKPIPRRTFLRGAGVTLALPWLEAMAIQTPQQSPSRFVAIFYPSGMAPGHWVPERTGPLTAVFPDSLENHSMSILKPLEPLREHLVVGVEATTQGDSTGRLAEL